MNRHAVSDLVNCSLQGWYRLVSEWRAPEPGTEQGCVSCRESEFASFDSTGDWPHELIHALVERLEELSAKLALSLHEESHSGDSGRNALGSCENCHGAARTVVHSSAQRHATDISDVIEECAMPRLAAYVEKNINLVLSAATRGEWAS